MPTKPFVNEPFARAHELEGPGVAHSCLEAVNDLVSTVEMLKRVEKIEER